MEEKPVRFGQNLPKVVVSHPMTIFEFLKTKLQGEPPVHPVEKMLAKRWVKERLKAVFPELRGNPRALEQAYRDLGLEARPGSGKGGSVLFEITLPGEIE